MLVRTTSYQQVYSVPEKSNARYGFWGFLRWSWLAQS